MNFQSVGIYWWIFKSENFPAQLVSDFHLFSPFFFIQLFSQSMEMRQYIGSIIKNDFEDKPGKYIETNISNF